MPTQWLTDAFQEFQKILNSAQPAGAADFADVFRAPLNTSAFGFGNTPNPFVANEWNDNPPFDVSAWQSVPPLGLYREWQTAWPEVMDAQVQQNKAGQALSRHLAAIFETAVKRFVKSINTPDDGLEDVTSLRQLYDLWVSIAEKAYAERVMSAEYSKTFGDFVNASARYRLAIKTLSSDVAEAANIPSRREIDALIARQHELAASIQNLQQRVESSQDTQGLEQELAQLSGRVSSLAAQRSETKGRNPGAMQKRAEKKPPGSGTQRKPRAASARRSSKSRPAKLEFDIASFEATNRSSKP